MRIVVDAMGSDRAPAVEVEGALDAVAVQGADLEVVLVGNGERIESELARLNGSGRPGVTVVHAADFIDMKEDAVRQVRRKKDASIAVANRLMKAGEAQGLVSAGNTGAVVTSCLLHLGRLKGVRRPAIATFVPSPKGGAILLDVGANSDCTPEHLLQFGVMGEIYARKALGRPEPKVGLLNIGEESSKGNKLVQGAYPLLKQSHLNFVGNVEGRDVFDGVADVVVCDGFTGNVVLKFTESVIHLFTSLIRDGIGADYRHRFGALLMRPVFRSLSQQLDYAEYGGAPLLGLDGVVIIAHGGSNPKAIKNAILAAARFAGGKINDHIRQELLALREENIDQVSP